MKMRVNDETENKQAVNGGEPGFTLLRLDPEKYREHLNDFDLSEDEQNELLETLWHIMRTMVDIGFGLDSVQIFTLAPSEKTGVDSTDSEKKLESMQSFNRAAGGSN